MEERGGRATDLADNTAVIRARASIAHTARLISPDVRHPIDQVHDLSTVAIKHQVRSFDCRERTSRAIFVGHCIAVRRHIAGEPVHTVQRKGVTGHEGWHRGVGVRRPAVSIVIAVTQKTNMRERLWLSRAREVGSAERAKSEERGMTDAAACATCPSGPSIERDLRF